LTEKLVGMYASTTLLPTPSGPTVTFEGVDELGPSVMV